MGFGWLDGIRALKVCHGAFHDPSYRSFLRSLTQSERGKSDKKRVVFVDFSGIQTRGVPKSPEVSSMKKPLLFLWLIHFLLWCPALADDYEQSVEEWHKRYQERLRAPEGYLSLIGLYWLKEESVTIPDFGRFQNVGDKVVVWVDCDHDNDCSECVRTEMSLELAEGAQKLRRGTKLAYLIQRGSWVGVRVKDSSAATRTEFQGVERFPTTLGWRIAGRLEPSPEEISVGSIVGVATAEKSPGWAVFELGGKTYRTRLLGSPSDKEFFMVFSDQSAGKSTYSACRFLYVERGEGDRLILDFNKAVNPMCAYTVHATCPLPPKQNILPFSVEAGELAPGK